MPSYGSGSSQFDQPVEAATNDKNSEDDWALIMDICDKVSGLKEGPRDILRSIYKRLSNKNTTVVLKAITLLDACVSNCGRKFIQEFSSKDSVHEFRKILSSSSSNSKVTEKFKSTLKKWTDGDLKSESLIVQLNNELKSGGYSTVSFDSTDSKGRTSSRSKAQDLQEKEIEDLARAMALSMQEAQQKSQQQQSSSSNASSNNNNPASLYPAMQSAVISGASATAGNLSIASSLSNSNEPRKVRALYDFEAAEENELTFKTGDVIFVLDDSDANWWRGYTLATPSFAQNEGLLFPSNFVTSDLTYQPAPENTKQAANAAPSATGTAAQPAAVDPAAVVIDEAKIDRGLALIQAADPTGEQRPDSDELLRIEQECRFMVPLVDTELERVDALHAKLTDVNQALVDAFAEYHRLMAAEVSDKRQQLTAMGGMMPSGSYGGMAPQYYDPSSAPGFVQPYGIPVAGAPGAVTYGLQFQQAMPVQGMQQPQHLSQQQDQGQPMVNNGFPQSHMPPNGYAPQMGSGAPAYSHQQQPQNLPPHMQQQQQMYSYNGPAGVAPQQQQQQPQQQPIPQYHPMPGPVGQV